MDFCGILELTGRVIAVVANITITVGFFLNDISTLSTVLFRQVTEKLKNIHHGKSPPSIFNVKPLYYNNIQKSTICYKTKQN